MTSEVWGENAQVEGEEVISLPYPYGEAENKWWDEYFDRCTMTLMINGIGARLASPLLVTAQYSCMCSLVCHLPDR